MQTIQTQDIDGYKIIIKINTALGMEDPEATRKIVEVEIQKTEVFKKILELKKQMGVYIEQATMAGRNAKNAKAAKQPWQVFWNEFQMRTAQYKQCEEDLKPLGVEFKRIYAALAMQHAVYFKLAQGEEYVSDAEADELESLMNEAYAEGSVLNRDKKKVIDNRGRVYWKKTANKWGKISINKLGEKSPGGGIQGQNLTTEQIEDISWQLESERVAGLNTGEKVSEKNRALTAIKSQAAVMNSELAVQGDAAALSKAQAWMASEIVKVEAKYA